MSSQKACVVRTELDAVPGPRRFAVYDRVTTIAPAFAPMLATRGPMPPEDGR